MKIAFFMAVICWLVAGCKKGDVLLSTHADDVFWVTNSGADMPVWVKGNTASKVFIFILHGGPGNGAYNYSGFETEQLQQPYAAAFWDQRNAGASAGNSNINRLTLDQMVNDLEQVLKVLKYRYGNDISIFLYCHSFGGLLGAAFLTKDTNQNNCKGWIDIDGVHNYPLADSLERKMLTDTGYAQIAKGNNTAAWQNIVSYCTTNNPAASLKVGSKTDAYAQAAETYMGVHPVNSTTLFSPEDPLSLAANLFKLYDTPAGKSFQQSLENINYSNGLAGIKIPSLLLWGQYDFTVPPGVGEDALNHLGSSYKKFIIFPNAGHIPMDNATEAAQHEIIDFVERFK